MAPPRDRYVYYPDAAEVPEAVAVEHPQPLVHDRRRGGRSTTPEAGGVLFSHGARFGGHALYIKDGRLKYVYNFLGVHEQVVESTDDDPDRAGTSCRRVVRAGGRRHADARARSRLYIGDEQVGEGRDQDPARQVLARRRGPQRRHATRPSRSPTTTPGTARGRSPAGTIKRVDRRRQRRAVRRPRAGGARDDEARVSSRRP